MEPVVVHWNTEHFANSNRWNIEHKAASTMCLELHEYIFFSMLVLKANYLAKAMPLFNWSFPVDDEASLLEQVISGLLLYLLDVLFKLGLIILLQRKVSVLWSLRIFNHDNFLGGFLGLLLDLRSGSRR